MSPSRGSSPVRSLGRSPSTAGFDTGPSGASVHPSGRCGQSRLGPGGGERNIKTVWVGQVQHSQHPAVTAVRDVLYAQLPINLATYYQLCFFRCCCQFFVLSSCRVVEAVPTSSALWLRNACSILSTEHGTSLSTLGTHLRDNPSFPLSAASTWCHICLPEPQSSKGCIWCCTIMLCCAMRCCAMLDSKASIPRIQENWCNFKDFEKDGFSNKNLPCVVEGMPNLSLREGIPGKFSNLSHRFFLYIKKGQGRDTR